MTVERKRSMNRQRTATASLLRYCAMLCLAAHMAYGSQILYTFTATTQATAGSESHSEEFQLTAPDFLPLVVNGAVLSLLRSDSALLSCVACIDPPIPTLHFLRSDSSDLLQFQDGDGILRPYFFSANAFSELGVHETLPGINVAVGKLVVAETPEPSTLALVLIGAVVAALRLRRRVLQLWR